MMIIRRFLPALPLFLLGTIHPAAADQATIEIENEPELNVSAPLLITPTSSIRGRELADCIDYKGKVYYKNKETTCGEMEENLKKCKKKLSKKMNFPKRTRIRDICPVACRSCDSDDGGITPSPPTPSPPTPSPPTPSPPSGKGYWGPLFKMNVISIHAMLVPGGKYGKILSYGTDDKGNQGANLLYEVWDLNKGVIQGQAHALLEHYTKTDLFCSSLNIDPVRGSVIIMGGDTRKPNNGLGVDAVQEYLPDTQRIVSHPKGDMKYPRWYPTSIILPSGNIIVVGGKSDTKNKGSAVPELYDANTGFRQLQGATVPIIAKEGNVKHWWYPHMWVNSKGQIVLIMPKTAKGKCYTYVINENGNGSIRETGQKPFAAHPRSPSIMFRIDTVLMIDDNGNLWVVDISDGYNLKFKKVNNVGSSRTNASFALLPDGRVTITGGCKSQFDGGNVLSQAVKYIQIWDPTNNKLTTGASETKSRLYHSSALITTYATVVSSGGGAPGPERNLNGQEYFPTYMPNNNQNLETITCPKTVQTNGKFTITVKNGGNVARVTATKSGSSSHTRNCDARWLEFDFIKRGNVLEISGVFIEGRVVPLSDKIMIPGLYLFNVLDRNGVPSKACLIGAGMNNRYL